MVTNVSIHNLLDSPLSTVVTKGAESLDTSITGWNVEVLSKLTYISPESASFNYKTNKKRKSSVLPANCIYAQK